ncbi:exonuclease SbcCD subunit D [Niveibacterium terrae]|uniref:exonuclease SbcCD subunit D n=1 Tax=Niveibacterium terrae TaxID=3373598 RepID=UPI003A9271C4
MRLLHTADWHLGRIFNAHSLIEDQAHLLREFVARVRDIKPDAVLIAGDVYDRAVPPADAVALLDETLSDIVQGLGVPVVMIAGNHDSGERLGFGAKLLAGQGLHVAGQAGSPLKLRLADRHGEVDLFALPYAEPAVVRSIHGSESTLDHAAAMRLQLDAIRGRSGRARRSVLLAHAFVSGGEESESERPLSIGGSGAVPAEVFKGFDYVALGHLHQAQSLAAGRLRYSGSLMKYSLSEVAHAKSVSLVELDEAGSVSVEAIALPPRRDLRVLEGSLAELIERGRSDPHAEDYVHARLTDAGALLDPMSRLRELYPNALSLERLVLARSGEGSARREALRQLDTSALFASFLSDVADEEMDDARRAAFAEVLRTLDPEGRSA